MKTAVWTIITAFVLWTSSADVWVQDAMAVSIGNTDLSGSSSTTTSTSTFTSVDGKPVNTNTATSITQLQNQQDTDNLNKQGDSSSTGLGLAAIAAGMAMVAAGMALMANPLTAAAGAALVAAGMMLIAAGMAALAAASNMRNNGNKANQNAGHLGPSTSGISGQNPSAAGTGDLSNQTGGSSIKIDPALARNGKVAEILSDFEKKTGLSQDDLINGLNSGKSPMEILSASPKVGKSENDLQKMMDKALANNAPLSAQDVMNKLGLTPDDLSQGAYTAGGGGDRKPASANATTDFDALFGKNNLDAAAAGAGALGAAGGSLSPEVQAALDRSGITSRTIFEMVHTQYKKKMPMMFGVKKEQLESGIPTAKPLYDLNGSAALEL